MEEKLIELVRTKACLYDTSHADYMKSKLKLQIWEEIGKEIGVTAGSKAKYIWEKLRHSLRDALRRQRKIMKSGTESTPIKLWKFQKQMEFLQPYMANRKRDSNIPDDSDEEVLNQNEEVNCDAQDMSRDIIELADIDDEDEGGQPFLDFNDGSSMGHASPMLTQETQIDRPGTSKETLLARKPRILKRDSATVLLKQALKNRERRSMERALDRQKIFESIKPPSDPLFHFFMSMYKITQQMPTAAQHIVRNNIYQNVTDMEAKLLHISSASQPQHQQAHRDQLNPYFNLSTSSSSPTSLSNDDNSQQSFINLTPVTENGETANPLLTYIQNFESE